MTKEELNIVISMIQESDALQNALDEAKEFIVRAQSRLAVIESTPNREALIELTDYIVERPF